MTAGQNASLLQTIGDDFDNRAGAPPGLRPRDYLEGTQGKSTQSGNAVLTSFNIPHGLVNDAGNGVVPTSVNVQPSTVAAQGALTSVTATVTNIVVAYVAAPANAANNLVWFWQAYR